MEIDNLDMKIIDVLVRNSKFSLRQIAKEVDSSVATIMNRIKRLEKEGIILGYTTLLDYEKMDYNYNVMIDMRIAKGKILEVGQQFMDNPNVYGIFDITGPWDLTLLCRFKNRKGLDAFVKKLQTLPNVERTETKLILSTVKEEPMKI